jgi:hypothetical protein
MARLPRIVVPGQALHIIQRGKNSSVPINLLFEKVIITLSGLVDRPVKAGLGSLGVCLCVKSIRSEISDEQ